MPGGRGRPYPRPHQNFTGKEQDVETGLNYFGARYYMPALARWTGVDPLAQKHAEWSPYNYVLNNPLGLKDPDGRQIAALADEVRALHRMGGDKLVAETASKILVGLATAIGVGISFTGVGTLAEGIVSTGADLATGGFSWKGAALNFLPGPSPKKLAQTAEVVGGLAKLAPDAATLGLGSLGRAGKSKGVREVVGDAGDARTLFDRLRGSNSATEVKPGVFTAPGAKGGTVTFRATSKSGPPTVDVHGIEEGIRKIKFVDQ